MDRRRVVDFQFASFFLLVRIGVTTSKPLLHTGPETRSAPCLDFQGKKKTKKTCSGSFSGRLVVAKLRFGVDNGVDGR